MRWSSTMRRVIANQHVKFDGAMHAPAGFEGHEPEGFEMPAELAEKMIARGSVRAAEAAAAEGGLTPGPSPLHGEGRTGDGDAKTASRGKKR